MPFEIKVDEEHADKVSYTNILKNKEHCARFISAQIPFDIKRLCDIQEWVLRLMEVAYKKGKKDAKEEAMRRMFE